MPENGLVASQQVNVEVQPEAVVAEMERIVAGMARELAIAKSINQQLADQIAMLRQENLSLRAQAGAQGDA